LFILYYDVQVVGLCLATHRIKTIAYIGNGPDRQADLEGYHFLLNFTVQAFSYPTLIPIKTTHFNLTGNSLDAIIEQIGHRQFMEWLIDHYGDSADRLWDICYRFLGQAQFPPPNSTIIA
jgi:hypothetical protein